MLYTIRIPGFRAVVHRGVSWRRLILHSGYSYVRIRTTYHEEDPFVISLLYVDDDPNLLELVKVFLESMGQFSVTTANGASGAFNALQTGHYDAIISDYQMPGMDGITFLKAVRERCGDIPFILFTGRGREEVVIEAINNGADFYLQKGGDPESQFAELIHKVRQAVIQRRSQKELFAAYEKIDAADWEIREHFEELARKEHQVRESEAKFRAIIDQSAHFIGLMTTDGTLIEVNRAALTFIGLSEKDVLRRPFWDTAWWAHSKELQERLKDAVKRAGANETVRFEATHRGADGKLAYIDFSLKPFLDSDGKVAYLIPEGLDITWLKHAEEALHVSEEKYRIFVETANEGIWAIDADFNTTFVNKKMQEMFGYTAEEMMGRPVWDFIPPNDVESMKAALLERRTGKPGRYERRWLKKDGSLVWCLTSGTPLFSPGGSFAGSFGLFTDITERMRMDTTLRESEEKYATVVEQSQDGIFIAQDGRLVFHNRAFSLMTGYPDEALDKRPIADLIAPEDRELVMTRHQERLEGKTPPEIYEFSALHRDGKSRIPVKMSIAAGTFHGIPATIGTLHNMTEERRRESILRESEERYRSIIENIHEGFVRMDSEGIILMANRSAVEMIGYESAGEMEGIPIVSFYSDPAEREKLIERMGTEGRVDGFETKLKKKDGSTFWASVDAHYYHTTTGELCGTEALFRDITERRQMEQALHDANRKLALLNSITRHDVANQLTILKGYVDMAAGEVGGTPVEGYLVRVESAAGNISRLLEYTRTYQELGGYAPGWFRIDEVLAKSTIPQVRINGRCGQYELFADSMIDRVFFNIFENAQRHGGNVTEICVRCIESQDSLVIVVEDDGPGIPDVEKEKIFERGYGKNTGFGLFLAREILSITGMTIRETGIEGRGARFEIRAPRMNFRRTSPAGEGK